jgi:carbon storage regulator
MLILTRRINETIVINDNILVTVCAVNGNQVRLGITAPTTIGVDRKEVFERKRAEVRDQQFLDQVVRERKTP